MFVIEAHTADVRLRVHAPTREALFVEAMRGLYGVMQAVPAAEARPVSRELTIDSINTTGLIVDFLNEILMRLQTSRELFTEAVFSALTDTDAVCTVTGLAPAVVEEDVKAVTYHEADVRQEPDGSWTTVLVLDI
ncbi:MAG TPA: archease [Thermoanaerobaculia bacterium]|jgi:SHS2 domain-containing protein